MINLNALIRLPLRAIPKSAIVPILSGPNRGSYWIAGSFVHGCWLGSYERPFVERVATALRPGMIAFDVGANAGYYSLILSRGVGVTGKVFAFEPSANARCFLLRHLQLNNITNVEVIDAAVTDRCGTALFNEEGDAFNLSDTGQAVRTVRLDDYPTPDFVKMDIEKAEALALRGAQRILAEHKTTWFIALHGEQMKSECLSQLNQHKYIISHLSPAEIWATVR